MESAKYPLDRTHATSVMVRSHEYRIWNYDKVMRLCDYLESMGTNMFESKTPSANEVEERWVETGRLEREQLAKNNDTTS